MNTTIPDTFESALLAELRSHVAERSAARRVRRQIVRRAAALAVAATLAGAIAVGLVGLRAEPAFALERNADGDIVVTVTKLSDADGLERALAAEGITAEVTYQASAARPSDLDDGGPAVGCPPVGAVIVDPADNGGVTFTLDAAYVAAHHHSVLHLTAAGGRSADDWIGVHVQWESPGC